MTEMESPLEDYADGLRFHFNGYFIWRLLCRRVGDALKVDDGLMGLSKHRPFSQLPTNFGSVLIFALISLNVGLFY